MRRVLVGAMLVAMLATAATAHAAYVYGGGTFFEYDALPGETNDVTIATNGAPGGLAPVVAIVHDAAATLTAVGQCTSVDPHTVSCQGDSLAAPWSIVLGDSDDAVGWLGAGPQATIDGGPGDDRLSAPAGGGHLDGGDGSDTLLGGIGADVLNGGAGADDERGGPGTDWSRDYAARTESVHVSLDDSPNDGARAEHDNIHSDVEDVDGGTGADMLTGSAADNVFDGGGGDDHVDPGLGRDTVLLGAGSAFVNVDDGMADTVTCGGGTAKVIADPFDAVNAC